MKRSPPNTCSQSNFLGAPRQLSLGLIISINNRFFRIRGPIDLDPSSERARLAPSWPLTSSHLNTASVYYLLDLSSFSLLSTPGTLFLYLRVLVFSSCVFIHFFVFFVSSVSSSTRAAVVATPQPSAIQEQHHIIYGSR